MEAFPSMFAPSLNDEFGKPMTIEEVHRTLILFAKDKSLGPDEWTVELFIHFFDIMDGDLLDMVEQLRLSS